MSIKNVNDFFAAVKEDDTLKEQTQAAPDPDTLVKIAQEHNYSFSTIELQTVLSKMSKQDLSAVLNPGIGTRLHLNPR